MCRTELILALIVVCCSLKVVESSSPDGWTNPSEPINALRGSEIRITCGVNGDKYSSQNLWFYNNSEPLNASFVRTINSSAIQMVVPNAQEQTSTIICKLDGQHGISYNDIKVGHEPDSITKIKCLSHNWRDMNCSFEKPYNPVTVHYAVSFSVARSQQIYECVTKPIIDPKIFRCYINKPVYRRSNSKFDFTIVASNTFKQVTSHVSIDNFASVIPEKPEKVTATDLTSDSVTLRWKPNSDILVFPRPFDFEFNITSACYSGIKKDLLLNQPSTDASDSPANFSHKIMLDFAHTWYDIEIRMKISTAPNNEEMWSGWVKKQLKTLPRAPDNPPEIDVASFNIHPSGDLFIYWKHLPSCLQNGQNYNYSVKSNNKNNDAPNEQTLLMAIYRKESVNLENDLKITIHNFNDVGISKKASELVVPARSRRLPEPIGIKKILANGEYELSWSPPNTKEPITSYTVFWCTAKSELPNHCDSSIDFMRRLPSELSFKHKSNQTVNFAVAANSALSTSGMTWARCTTANSNEIGKIKTIWIPRLTSTQIEVEWKLECTDSGIVAGYQIEYCPSKEPKTLECMENSQKKINITGDTKHTLKDLKPYTTYKIAIKMFSNSTMGPASEPLANTTLEAAPTDVRNLIYRDVRNTSVELYWDPPEFFNGVLLFYKVWANGKDYKVDSQDHSKVQNNATNGKISYMLNDLLSFTKYSIAVEACTKECSNASTIEIETKAGTPGNFSSQPLLIDQGGANILRNHSSTIIRWEEPVHRGGNLDYYEVRAKFTPSNDGEPRETIIKTRARECYVHQLCVNNVSGRFDFSVRAVNYLPTPHSREIQQEPMGPVHTTSCYTNDSELMEWLKTRDPFGWYLNGYWSPSIGHTCGFPTLDIKQYVMFLMLMFATLIIVLLVFYFYRKIKDMKDILVQMPPGLEDLTGEIKKSKDISGGNEKVTPDILRNVDTTSINCEDEHGQLLKSSLNGSIHGADCSSSMHSGSSTRSDIDQVEHDDIEYTDFGRKHKNLISDDDDYDDLKKSPKGLQSFILNPTTGKESVPILISSDSMPTSTPIADKCPKPSIIFNSKMSPSNGYVQPPMPSVSSPMSSGYVTHSMFNPMQSSGYTQLNAFGKPILNHNSAMEEKLNIKTPIVATTDQEGISGYVTHKQLSDFGHSRMQ